MPLLPFTSQDLNQVAALAFELTQAASTDVFQIGEFIIGGGDTSSLGGHPDIRY